MGFQLIIIGCSLGGLNAMRVLLSRLSPEHEVPIVLVQHRDKNPNLMLTRILQRSTHLKVEDADDGTAINRGCLYIAPAGYHLLIEEGAFSLSTELPVHYAMPSIDVAFETAARSYGKSLIALVLTSSSEDGADGAAIVESRGGCVIIQEPATAENATLPRAALRKTKSPRVAKLEEISVVLQEVLTAKEKGGERVRREPR